MRSLYTEDIEGNLHRMQELNLNPPSSKKVITDKNIRKKLWGVQEIQIRHINMNGLYPYQKSANLIIRENPTEIP